MSARHPNDPAPSAGERHREAAVEMLLVEQERGVERFRALIEGLIGEIGKIGFPLGSPVAGYDVADVVEVLREWVPATDPLARHEIEELAWDRVEGGGA